MTHSNRDYNAGTLTSRSGSIRVAAKSSAIPGPRSVILRSAYRAPLAVQREQWTRDPPMIESLFIRTKATINTEGNVDFSVIDGLEAIEIAGDWEKGEALYDQRKPHETTGFVGKGYSKRGIYVSGRHIRL